MAVPERLTAGSPAANKANASVSAQIAPALELGGARLGQLEIADPDRTLRPVVRDDDAGRVGFRLDELQPRRNGAVAEEALALAQQQREDQYAELVDKAILPQRLEQIA